MKRFVSLLFFIISASGILIIANPVEFKFSAGSIDDGSLKTQMENNISALLTEINSAVIKGSALELNGIAMDSEAKARLNALWKDSPFVCDKQINISKCLNDFQGYQVRAIPVTMKPADSSYDLSIDRELSVSLDKSGVITGVRLALESIEDISKILSGAVSVDDTRQRRDILKWVEDYKSYYYERNIDAIAQIFDGVNDLISTDGKVEERSHADKDTGAAESKVVYRKHAQESYINNLKKVFTHNQRIKFEIDHISVVKHGAKPNIYGVTLHQKLQSGSYCDEGWLFLVWDFNDPEKPQINIKTWQPDPVADKQGVYSLDDIFLF